MLINHLAITKKTGYSDILKALKAYKHNGDPNAAWFLIEVVRPMVASLVNLYEGYAISLGFGTIVSKDDLMQEAYSYLLKSIQDFSPPEYALNDPTACIKSWNRYANLVIKSPIRDSYSKSINQVDIPNWAVKIAGRINQAIAAIETDHFMSGAAIHANRRPSPILIAQKARLPPSKVKSFLAHGFDLLPQSHFASFDEDSAGYVGSAATRSDYSETESGMGLTDAEHHLLSRYFQLLDEQQQQIVSYRFGLDGSPQTHKATGALLGLTPKQVRLIESKAIQRLRDYLLEEDSL